MLSSDLDPCSGNARTLSGPEGSSNKGCLRQARTPGLFFLAFLAFFGKRLSETLVNSLSVPTANFSLDYAPDASRAQPLHLIQ